MQIRRRKSRAWSVGPALSQQVVKEPGLCLPGMSDAAQVYVRHTSRVGVQLLPKPHVWARPWFAFGSGGKMNSAF